MSKSIRTVSVLGLGYVGLPVCVGFGRKYRTIGFDISKSRIEELLKGIDRNHETESAEILQKNITYTTDIHALKEANFHIVAVPTPIDDAKQPDLSPVVSAAKLVGSVLKKGDIVVYESTVYPGLTEEVAVPIMDEVSGLKAGIDYKVGYSPERMNPGDKEHSFSTIKKVVSAQDEESLAVVAEMYGSVVTAGVHKASSIRVAEAAKVIENTQRDLNIALMNELAIIFDRMNIDTQEVIEAASTKWNFLKFSPGLVGGHCIGVDPYYLTHKAEKLNYIPQVILAGRRINDGMGKLVAQKTIKEMIHAGHVIQGSTVTVLGLTFKENCSDLRNSRVVDIVAELEEYGVKVQLCDPAVNPGEVKRYYKAPLFPMNDLPPADAVVVAVAHKEFREIPAAGLRKFMKDKPVVVDVKGLYSPQSLRMEGYRFWRL